MHCSPQSFVVHQPVPNIGKVYASVFQPLTYLPQTAVAPCSVLLSLGRCCGTPGGQSEPACAARRWLARNAAAVRFLAVTWYATATALACTSLVTCLPALEHVDLSPLRPMVPKDLERLLEALASCPRLGALCLRLTQHTVNPSRSMCDESKYPIVHTSMPNLGMVQSLAPFAKLRSLTKVSLYFGHRDFYPLPNVVGALASLTGLAELTVRLPQPAVVPAALGQLTGLRSLRFERFESCVLEAGCFDLPNLLTLEFHGCFIEDAGVFARVPALPSLTCIDFWSGEGPPFVVQLIQLPHLRRMVFDTFNGHCKLADYSDAYAGLPRLPSHMSPKLVRLCLAGHALTQFPLALTQLVALEYLDASDNEFAELPVTITALSRLTQLLLGRLVPEPVREQPPLDVRALGDLSAFPALCKLDFNDCEVMLCASMLGVAWHASLVELVFYSAKLAPECASIVQALERLGRGSILKFNPTVDV